MVANTESPSVGRRISAYVRMVAFYVFSALYLPVIIACALMRIGDGLWYVLLRGWAATALRIYAVSVTVAGDHRLQRGQDYVVLANHRSNFDVFALIAAFGDRQTRWVAKRELERVPIFGYGLRATGQILIDRHDHEQALREIRAMLGKHGVTVVFFAEGQRAPTTDLLPFKKGGAAFAIDASLPIVPVAISGSEKVLPRHSLISSPGTIRVIIGEPIDTAGTTVTQRDALTNQVRGAIESMLADCESPRPATEKPGQGGREIHA